MKKLSVWLPPFAGDYSGACSALFDFNCLIILNDAACCTRNYVEYEEPRWTREKRTTFSAQLRTVEVTLGDDCRVLSQAAELAERLRPDFTALLGSPVPALVGMDMKGMAAQLEYETGIPAIGFDTSGFASYDRGVSIALSELVKRFSRREETVPDSVNLLGLTPLDFGAKGSAEAIRGRVEELGFSVLFSGAMGTSFDELKNAANAGGNIVLSWSGLRAAKEMKRRWGIPYFAGVPIGNGDVFSRELPLAMEHGSGWLDAPADGEGAPILIVSEQVLGCSLRAALRSCGCRRPIHLAGFFGWESSKAQPPDSALEGEAQLVRLLSERDYRIVIGDPLLEMLPCMRSRTLLHLAHPAVSGSLHWDEVPLFTGGDMEAFLREVSAL